MLNVDIKILSKALAKKLKEVLPCLISTQQNVYDQNRNIGKSERLISDIIEITNTRQMEGLLVTMDVKKTCLIIPQIFNFSFEKIWIWSKLYLVDRNNFQK